MPIRRHRKTRIIATLGPSSNTNETIGKLLQNGVDVFRLNMSHGDHADKKSLARMIREEEAKVGRPCAILADLQGPKIRVGTFADGPILLENGATFTLDTDPTPGDQNRVCLPHPELFEAMRKDVSILLDDGKVRLNVVKAEKDTITTEVIVGGKLSDRKGVNVPNTVLPVSAMTEKDLKDLKCALEIGVEWIALSFVQKPEDVIELRKLVGDKAAIMAKIEKPAAVDCIEDILDVSDAVMVARGDLGVEMNVELVPTMQKHIIAEARDRGKPVVVATQMLESMITSPMPTRAEVSDVANAIFDGADAVMLSAESAAGDFPLEAVAVMDRVAREVENDPTPRYLRRDQRTPEKHSPEQAISAAARQVASKLNASAIVCFTTSGSTAMRVAKERPHVPTLCLTPSLKIARQLCLVWGLRTVNTKDVESFEQMVGKSKRMALRRRLAEKGCHLVITAGVPFGTPGATNVLHVTQVTGDELIGYEDET